MGWKSRTIVAISVPLNIPNSGLVTFAAQIVSGMGYGALQTTLLGMPIDVFQSVSECLCIHALGSLSRDDQIAYALGCILLSCSVDMFEVHYVDLRFKLMVM